MKDRFARLAALTRGAALITVSTGSVGAVGGCTKNDLPPPPAAAGAIQPDPAADPGDASADAVAPRRRFPILNAMHPSHDWNTSSDGGGSADGGGSDKP
jgi:hypothetical protein